ncbi:excalibur calcium-binding domain-containing protein [Erythrobacter westpacificensis]|uniref:excalibur calcium-binding domain-containing protein n=1 Tax=Erythrobacter westpacificensis TaxID=1055231 RepID=UPI003D15AFCE
MARSSLCTTGLFLIAGVFPYANSVASAHGGRLAADGCHMDRSTGVRHCHRGQQAEQPQRGAEGEIYYPNCDAARRAGAAPVLRGQPGYGRHLDRDGDGRGCE